MICDNCNERPASVVVTQSKNGKTEERHLCDVCAAHFQPFQGDFGGDPLGIQQFLQNWFAGPGAFQKTAQPQVSNGPECPNCGLTFRRFIERGKFGCAECYNAFRKELPEVFNKVQAGHTRHEGKVPASYSGRIAAERKIKDLRRQMKEAINQEEFEQAAKLRDEVRELERGLEEGGGQDVVD